MRRKLIEDEAVRVLARKDRTLITENRLGLVQAAAGVDGSNVGRSELALLPVDPDASAATLRAGLRERLGVTVAVVITDTMGRAWRNGQTDAAVGAAGLAVLRNYAGVRDPYGNELVVTEVAVADEIAAAADLVKGKLTATPVAWCVGSACPTTARQPGNCCGRAPTTCSGSGPPKRSSWVASKPNCCAGPFAGLAPIRCRATSSRLRSPRPSPRQPHITPGRPDSCGCRHRPSAPRLLDRMKDKWRSDLTSDGLPADAIERRVARGQILYDAPEVVIPMLVPDGAHSYPDAARTDAEHTMFTVAVGAAVQALLVALAVRGLGSCWIGSTIFAADLVRDELDLPVDWEPLGAIAIGYADEPSGLRDPVPAADLLILK